MITNSRHKLTAGVPLVLGGLSVQPTDARPSRADELPPRLLAEYLAVVADLAALLEAPKEPNDDTEQS